MFRIPRLTQAGVLTPAQWDKIASSIDANFREVTLQNGQNTRVDRSSGGQSVNVSLPSPTSIAADPKPFQVIQGPANSEGRAQIGVISNSHVINSSDKDAYEEDNSEWGLLADDAPKDDPNWFSVPDKGEKIWLQFTFDEDGGLTSIDLQKGPVGEGNLWDEYPDPISINVDDPDNPYQEFYNQIIAEITDPEQDPRPGFSVLLDNTDTENPEFVQVTQLLDTNLVLLDAVTTDDADEPNVSIMVVMPFHGPTTSVDGNADTITDGQQDIKTPWVLGLPKNDPWHPFKVHDESDEDGTKISVDANSDLWKYFGVKQAITGLGSPIDGVTVGDLIYIVIEMNSRDDVTPKTAEIRCDAPWEEHPNPHGMNTDDPDKGPWQQYYNQLIAEVVSADPAVDPRDGMVIGPSGKRVKIIQHLKTSLLCTQWAVNGIVCMVPEEKNI